MRLAGFAFLALSFTSAAQAQDSVLNCAGRSKSQVPVVISFTSNDEGTTGHVKAGASEFDGEFNVTYIYRASKPPILKFSDLENDKSFVFEPKDNGVYRLIYSMTVTDINTYRTTFAAGEVEAAVCTAEGFDESLVESAPASAADLWNKVTASKNASSALRHALDIAATAEGIQNTGEFFYSAFDFLDTHNLWQSSRADDIGLVADTARTAFLISATAAARIELLNFITTPERLTALPYLLEGLSAIADNDIVIDHIVETIKALPAASAVRQQSILRLAAFAFNKQSQTLSRREQLLSFLFAKDLLASQPILTGYIRLLSAVVAKNNLASDAAGLLTKCLEQTPLPKVAAEEAFASLLRREDHVVNRFAETAYLLNKLLESHVLSEVSQLKAIRQLRWLEAEEKMRAVLQLATTERSQMILQMVLARNNEPFFFETVLQWLLEQDAPVPLELEIVKVIGAHLPNIETRYLSMPFAGQMRGLSEDLVRYAFFAKTDKRERLDVLNMVLNDSRTPAATLNAILNDLATPVSAWNTSIASEILRAVARHPQFFTPDQPAVAKSLVRLLNDSLTEGSKVNLDPLVLRALVLEALDKKKLPASGRAEALKAAARADSI